MLHIVESRKQIEEKPSTLGFSVTKDFAKYINYTEEIDLDETVAVNNR